MGQKIPSKEVYHGRNASTEGDTFVRCSRCGFVCEPGRDQQAPDGSRIGWGITNTALDICVTTYDDVERTGLTYGGDTAITYNEEDVYDNPNEYDGGTGTNYNGVEKTIYDPIVHSGCSQCGTMRYDK